MTIQIDVRSSRFFPTIAAVLFADNPEDGVWIHSFRCAADDQMLTHQSD